LQNPLGKSSTLPFNDEVIIVIIFNTKHFDNGNELEYWERAQL